VYEIPQRKRIARVLEFVPRLVRPLPFRRFGGGLGAPLLLLTLGGLAIENEIQLLFGDQRQR
jgi:hypothetical protein